MSIQTPSIAEKILSTDLSQFPLIDFKLFKKSFFENPQLYLEVHLNLTQSSEKDTELYNEICNNIDQENFSFEGDFDFNHFTAHSIVDFYIKALRRTVSITILNDSIGKCFDQYITPEQNLLDKLSKKLDKKFEKTSKEYKIHDDKITETFAIVLDYEEQLQRFLSQITAFDLNFFDSDLSPYLQYAHQRRYPYLSIVLLYKIKQYLDKKAPSFEGAFFDVNVA